MERKSCYNCKYYNSFIATCKNNTSEKWECWTTIDDVCDDWEEDEENGDD